MLVSVLSPGPSLANVTREDLSDSLIIGVNRAVHHLRCDWWCFGDDRMYRTYKPDYPVEITTNEEMRRRLKLEVAVTWESLYPSYSPETRWYQFSFTAAIAIAASLGATQVNVYGCDWAGASDFDGHRYTFKDEEAEKTRTPDRWERERGIYQRTIEMLANQGVKVNRINGNL